MGGERERGKRCLRRWQTGRPRSRGESEVLRKSIYVADGRRSEPKDGNEGKVGRGRQQGCEEGRRKVKGRQVKRKQKLKEDRKNGGEKLIEFPSLLCSQQTSTQQCRGITVQC